MSEGDRPMTSTPLSRQAVESIMGPLSDILEQRRMGYGAFNREAGASARYF